MSALLEPPLLDLHGVSRSFGGVRAVRDVSLSLGAGEFLSIIGPNGAGKTTLFNLISGHDVPDAGGIALDGVPIAGLVPERIAALGMARTFQHGRVFATMSVRDNILIGAHHRLRAAKPRLPGLGALAELAAALIRPPAVVREEHALRHEAEQIAAMFGERLTPRLDQPAYSLSYANRRRVEIARALALRPRLLLLDEPTAGMNETETAEMADIIAALKAGGQTILLIEHKLDLVMRLSDRVIAMDDGSVIAAGSPAAVRVDPAVIEAYLGHSALGEAVR
ncbi:MAG: branched-chain amino acid transport system ATP-binding protein [Acetobacteraceae bacterium]|nr:branched-chain amino acid transport system ATP-binding protein [Acetobacteraceae bacterium]